MPGINELIPGGLNLVLYKNMSPGESNLWLRAHPSGEIRVCILVWTVEPWLSSSV